MRRWIQKWLKRVLVLFILLLALFFALRSKYRVVISDLARTQVMNTTSDLTNDAIARQIAQGDIQYDRIVFFRKGSGWADHGAEDQYE